MKIFQLSTRITAGILIFLSLLIFTFYNPMLEIYGYPHEVESSPGCFITVDGDTLGGALSDSYYPAGLQCAYFFFGFFLFASVFLSIVVLIKFMGTNLKSALIFYGIVSVSLVAESILLICLFSFAEIAIGTGSATIAFVLVSLVINIFIYRKEGLFLELLP